MTDPIRTPAEALEAAAQEAAFFDDKDLMIQAKKRDGTPKLRWDDREVMVEIRGVARDIEKRIRALAPRIAATDDEALMETVARRLCVAQGSDCNAYAVIREPGKCDRSGYRWELRIPEARAVITALREAGALRHE